MNEDLYIAITNTAQLLKSCGILLFKNDIDTNLGPQEFHVLKALIESDKELSQLDISSVLLITKAHIGFILTSLEEKGYIQRFNNKKNGKFVKFSRITESGMNEYKKVCTQLTALRKIVGKGISLKRRELLIRDLNKIQANFQNYYRQKYKQSKKGKTHKKHKI